MVKMFGAVDPFPIKLQILAVDKNGRNQLAGSLLWKTLENFAAVYITADFEIEKNIALRRHDYGPCRLEICRIFLPNCAHFVASPFSR